MHAYLYDPCARNVVLLSEHPLTEDTAFAAYQTVCDDPATEDCECVFYGEIDETNQYATTLLGWLSNLTEYDHHVEVVWRDNQPIVQTAKFSLSNGPVTALFAESRVSKYGFAVIEIVQH